MYNASNPMGLFTANYVADKYGYSRQRVHELAKLRNVRGMKIGRDILFTAEQAKALKPRPRAGRPKGSRKRKEQS